MATRAYVLVETAVGKSMEIADALRRVKGVNTIDAVSGPYDIILVLDADDLHSVGETIKNDVHTISGIVRTVTCLALT